MAFTTSQAVLAALVDALQLAGVAAAQPKWGNITARVWQKAEVEVARALAQRGYTPAQLALADEPPVLVLDLATFYGLTLGGALAKLDVKGLKEVFDRREELKTVQVTSGGKFIYPEGSAGQCGVGSLDASTDEFVWPGDHDRLGEETRF